MCVYGGLALPVSAGLFLVLKNIFNQGGNSKKKRCCVGVKGMHDKRYSVKAAFFLAVH